MVWVPFGSVISSVSKRGRFGLATTTRKARRMTVKQMKFRNDPMVRLYDKTQEWLQELSSDFAKRLALIGLSVTGFIALCLVLVVIGVAAVLFMSYRESRAAADFADAWSKFNAQVTETAPQNGAKYYTDEKVKWQEASQAFETV